MIRQIYVEESIADHPRTASIIKRFPRATVIPCQHYGELFNVKAQNFRLQKRQPALVLAGKAGNAVLPAPSGYGIGSEHNFYFSHMLNCLYDCRYCYLQGMYRSANYVVFVNYDHILQQIEATASALLPQCGWFFSGYDCDSLAMEPITGFMQAALPFFAARPQANLEIRTKSTQIRCLLDRRPMDNCVVAFSFTPATVSRAVENGVPSVEKRLVAMKKLQGAGWKLGLRLDPLVYTDDFERQYRGFLEQVFQSIDARCLHSVSLGAFRLPKDYYRQLVKLYPREQLFASPHLDEGKMVSYSEGKELYMQSTVLKLLRQYVNETQIFACSWPGSAG